MPAVKKATAKKPVATKKNSPATKASTGAPKKRVKSAVGRPKKELPTPAPESEFELLDPEENAKKRIAGMSYAQLSELTGIQINTEQFIVALEILRGGRDRQEINDRCRQILPATTPHGTPKPVPNLVSGVIKKLEAKGFTIKGDWKMVKPGRGA